MYKIHAWLRTHKSGVLLRIALYESLSKSIILMCYLCYSLGSCEQNEEKKRSRTLSFILLRFIFNSLHRTMVLKPKTPTSHSFRWKMKKQHFFCWWWIFLLCGFNCFVFAFFIFERQTNFFLFRRINIQLLIWFYQNILYVCLFFFFFFLQHFFRLF